ncbi:hypothetical protein F3U47_14830 [Escherichia coli]|nr:hypothetical protein [Escherichia coli]EHW5529820.1 hypothetical protein [Escherichia coli]EKB6220863.1 hypothetical protein [Escherichia coli]EKD5857105.1 hypothetical protein [Escherichia coli]
MKIDGYGDIPLGEPKWMVVGLGETSDRPENYIGIKFNLGNRAQKHFGKIIEEILYNPEYMAQSVLDDILSKENKLSKGLLEILEQLNLPRKPDNLFLRDVEFYSHKESKHFFNFTNDLYDRISVNVTTDIDLNPLEVKLISRGNEYYTECFHDFKFYDLRYFKDIHYLNELKESVLWVEGVMNKKAPRLYEYIKMFETYENTIPGTINEEQVKISISHIELEGLRIVYQAFKDRNENLNEKIKSIIKGVAFKYKQDVINDDKCREFLYELKVAACFLFSGYSINVSQRADVVINNDTFIECKKITSEKKLITRIDEALEQIEVKEGVRNGIIYVDITESIPDLKDAFLIINNKTISYFNLNSSDPEKQFELELRMVFFNKINEYSINLIQRNIDKIRKKIGDSVLVLNVELPVLHLSPLHERMGIIKIAYIISNRVDLRLNFIVENSMRSLSELYPKTKS